MFLTLVLSQAAERLIASEGELKSQLEDFRRDPDISSEFLILLCTNNYIIYFYFCVSVTML
jgi:hypothetical protein